MTNNKPFAQAYRESRNKIEAVLSEHKGDFKEIIVPGSPEWSVHDVVAHLAGILDDISHGIVEGVGSKEWTAVQVQKRKGSDTFEVLNEWNSLSPQFEEGLDALGRMGKLSVMDVVTHEFDICGALQVQCEKDTSRLDIAFDFIVNGVVHSAIKKGITVGVIAGEEYGNTVEGPVLEASKFDAFRALTGRRSEAQILSMNWEGDPKMALPALNFGPFSPSLTDVFD
ncbi:MAG: hypothetical protein HKL80_09875 [Acidimicrobiales bacterium]|nr:hypothetical protein [Acidimicrobiales bacterium]